MRNPAYDPAARARLLEKRTALAAALRAVGITATATSLERDDAVGRAGGVIHGDVARAAVAYHAQLEHVDALRRAAEASGNTVLVAELTSFRADHMKVHYALYDINTELGDILNAAIDPRGA